DVQSFLVHGDADSLIGGGASLHDDLVQLGVLDVIVVVGGTFAVVDLIHVGIHSGLPSGGKQLSGASLHLREHVGRVGNISDNQVHTDLLQSILGQSTHHEGGVVALTAAADDQLIVHLGACGSSGDLAVLHGVASSLKEAQSGLLGSGVLLLVAHAIGVDGVVVDVGGEGHLIAGIGNLRSGPRGIGDGV